MRDHGSSPIIIVIAIVVLAMFFGGGSSGAGISIISFFKWIFKTALLASIGLALLIGGIIALIIFLENKKEKDQALREKNDPTLNDPHSPKNIEKTFDSFRTSVNLGPIARSAIQQKARMEEQQKKYSTMLKRRFSEGTLTYTKYMQLEQEYTDAMYNEFLKIANRMIAFDDHEYQMLESGQFRHDSIPDDIQYERLNLYRQNLQEMRDALKHNETTILAVDQLMLKLADSDYTESGVQSQVDELKKQLDYYKKQ